MSDKSGYSKLYFIVIGAWIDGITCMFRFIYLSLMIRSKTVSNKKTVYFNDFLNIK